MEMGHQVDDGNGKRKKTLQKTCVGYAPGLSGCPRLKAPMTLQPSGFRRTGPRDAVFESGIGAGSPGRFPGYEPREPDLPRLK